MWFHNQRQWKYSDCEQLCRLQKLYNSVDSVLARALQIHHVCALTLVASKALCVLTNGLLVWFKTRVQSEQVEDRISYRHSFLRFGLCFERTSHLRCRFECDDWKRKYRLQNTRRPENKHIGGVGLRWHDRVHQTAYGQLFIKVIECDMIPENLFLTYILTN